MQYVLIEPVDINMLFVCSVALNNTIPTGFIEPVDIKCYFQDSTGNFLVLSPRMEWTLPSNPILLQVSLLITNL